MTRINTNVSSLTAQQSLARSNAQLQTSLTRLSTGLRINSGKDDPAGLIASQFLNSSIAEVTSQISGAQRENAMMATADSALGQVSSLLDDIRGLVEQSANTGAMSEAEIAANQLSIDSSLEAINRISSTSSFAGRKLLDGGGAFAQINVNDLGTATGSSLASLATDGANALGSGNLTKATDVVAEVTRQVSELRGRLGAQQAVTLETATASLSAMKESLASAQSAIMDTDFASECAGQTRSQILVQSGMSVLALANQAPQRVLSLLGTG
jgi:flagellin-like hook-associated protein FlgL